MCAISVIICTYNRPNKVIHLVEQLCLSAFVFDKIIIVDSSDKDNEYLKKNENIIYKKSRHRNQPYQRFLGATIATSEYLLFLDDDMEVIQDNVFQLISDMLSSNTLSGLALNFKDKEENTSLSIVPKSKLSKFGNTFQRLKGWITGYPILDEGKLGLCGIRGKKPVKIKSVEYVSGGAFLAKKDLLLNNFNYQLLSLFEEKIGMGEDTIIGYGLSRQGKVLFIPEIYFWHNDQKDSNYSVNLEKYSQRVLFSRLYLSLERNRLANKSLFFAKVHYHWYSMNRVLGLGINYILQPNLRQKNILKGAFNGWIQSLIFRFSDKLEQNNYWLEELEENIKCQA